MLTEKIKAIHTWSRGTYGAPRIHAELCDEGTYVGCRRVARLLQAAGLQGVSRRKGVRTTLRSDKDRPAPDPVERDFSADAPNQLRVADITYIPTVVGFFYLSVVLDAFSCRIVGWSIWSASCSIENGSKPEPKRGWSSVDSLKAGTTPIGGTRRLSIIRR